MIRRLLAAGLNKQQAYSTTAETMVSLFMPEDGKMLIREAKLQVDEMKKIVNALKAEYEELKGKTIKFQARFSLWWKRKKSMGKSLKMMPVTRLHCMEHC